MLSEEGPSFNLDNVPGSVSTTVAVTPFKDGKGPPLNGLLVSLPLLSDNVTNTVAVTPMHRSLPPLAPLPLVRFTTPQYIMPLHKPGVPIVPIFVPPYHFRLPMLDGLQTSSLPGNGPHMPPVPFAPFCSVPINLNAEEFYPGEAAADTEETTGAMRVEKQAAINSARLRISLPI
ncbi:unnamed protein product [Sphagnum tenellum]